MDGANERSVWNGTIPSGTAYTPYGRACQPLVGLAITRDAERLGLANGGARV
jgi:hypothetical protein